MGDDKDLVALRELNIKIGEAESAGDHDSLAKLLAPRLAFLRADGKTLDDRVAFLQKVGKSDPRSTAIESIDLVGKSRAVVRAVVTMTRADGSTERFHNLRVFIKQGENWRLLAWANEKLA
jgi:hypothetical protein